MGASSGYPFFKYHTATVLAGLPLSFVDRNRKRTCLKHAVNIRSFGLDRLDKQFMHGA